MRDLILQRWTASAVVLTRSIPTAGQLYGTIDTTPFWIAFAQIRANAIQTLAILARCITACVKIETCLGFGVILVQKCVIRNRNSLPLAFVDLHLTEDAFIAVRAVARKLADAIHASAPNARTAPALINVSLAIRSDDAINALAFVTTCAPAKI